MSEDSILLQAYAATGSQEAFATLVNQRVGLVYSLALRRTGGDVHAARDATQAVFIDLARKAGTLAQRPTIAGWLCRSAQFAASDLMRERQRREQRDEKAFHMNLTATGPAHDPDWDQLRPELDEALARLNDRDRDAVLLRFIDNLSFGDIGRRCHLTEQAARRRVNRALEKLRSSLARRGITSTVAALSLGIAGEAAEFVPVGLAGEISTATLAPSTAAAATGLAALFTMTTLKIALSVATAGAIAAAAIVLTGQETTPSASSNPPALSAPSGAQSAITKAPTGTAPASKKAKKKKVNKKLLIDPAKYAAWLAAAHDPALRQKAYELEEQQVQQRYGPLFDKLKLSPDAQAQFMKLLVDSREADADVFVATIQSGLDPRNNVPRMNEQIVQARSDIDLDIQDLLGPDQYATYQNYAEAQILANQTMYLERIQTSLEASGNQMTDQQLAQLKALLGNGALSIQVIHATSGFLNPVQQKALLDMRESQHQTKAKGMQEILPPLPADTAMRKPGGA